VTEITLNPREYLLAGGSLSLAEWVQLDEEERAAFVEAGVDMRVMVVEMLVSAMVSALNEATEELRLQLMADKVKL